MTTALLQAAQAVLDRWYSPSWSWAQSSHTGDLMNALRRAIDAQPRVTHITWNAAGVRTVNGVPDYVAQPEQLATKCKKCAGQMKPGQAIAQTFSSGLPDFPGDAVGVTISPGGPGKLIDCLKCECCGWSVTGTPPADQFVDVNKAMQPLTELQRMQIIGNEFPPSLVQPLVIQKIDTVCQAIEAAMIAAHIKTEKD